MLNTRCAYLSLKPFARLNGSKDPAISNKAMYIVMLDKNQTKMIIQIKAEKLAIELATVS